MKHVIVGTAGHIDHGKTALVKALTGIDADRLEEEKTPAASTRLAPGSNLLAKPSQHEHRFVRLREPCNANGIPSDEFFDLDIPKRAVLDANHLWRETAPSRKVDEIGIRGKNRIAILARVLPDDIVWRVLSEAQIENMRDRKQIRQPLHQPRRKIGVQQELQRVIRSRPNCDAYA